MQALQKLQCNHMLTAVNIQRHIRLWGSRDVMVGGEKHCVQIWKANVSSISSLLKD